MLKNTFGSILGTSHPKWTMCCLMWQKDPETIRTPFGEMCAGGAQARQGRTFQERWGSPHIRLSCGFGTLLYLMSWLCNGFMWSPTPFFCCDHISYLLNIKENLGSSTFFSFLAQITAFSCAISSPILNFNMIFSDFLISLIIWYTIQMTPFFKLVILNSNPCFLFSFGPEVKLINITWSFLWIYLIFFSLYQLTTFIDLLGNKIFAKYFSKRS